MTSTASKSALLDLLFDDPAAGRCLVAPDGTVRRANATWLRLAGLSREATLGAKVAGPLAERAEVERVATDDGTGLLLTLRLVPRSPAAGCGAAAELLERIRAVADHAPAAVWVKRADGRYLFANRWLEELFGLLHDGAVGRTASDFLPREAARRIDAHDRRVATGEELASEERVPTAGGERVLMAIRFPFPLGDGSIGTFGIGVDVTQRTRAESALRESEERFRLLAEAMPQIVCVLGPAGVPEYVNRSWVELSGLDLEATRRVGWEGAVHPDDVPAVRECRRQALKRLAPQDLEVRYRVADGTYRWFLCRLAPVVERTRVVRLVGAGMDIEDRWRREEALREQLALRDQLSKVAASVPGVVCSFRLRPDGTVTMPFSGPAIEELYGFTQAELAKDMAPVFARTPARDLERVKDQLAASARTLEPWRAEFRYEHPMKGLRWMSGTSMPSREADGGVLWHGYVADVTDRKRADEALRDANERLREADRRKDEFLGMLSHELRNPLAPIRSAIYILRRHGEGTEQGRRAKDVIERQTEHLTRLVDDLLDVTRIARGKIELRRARVDLRELVRRAAEDLRQTFEERRVAFRVSLPEEHLYADADGTRIAQVIGNLLHNAAKFTLAGDEVIVALRRADACAEISVSDTGAGIEPPLLPRIFEPFVQGERGLARTQGGLGLGLALVKGIAELHGGTVRAESGGGRQGTTVTVRLPLAARSPVQVRSAAPAAPGAGSGRRVLVVDDNRDAADTLAELVNLLGHEAEVAYDGRAALDRVKERAPDVVLCDLGLPGMDGYEVARRIRETSGAQVRLVAVSGYAQPEDVARATAAGFDGHVPKPADPARIEDVLR